MCRHVAYVGPPVPIAAVVLDPPHSLEHQAFAARELISGSVAADGFGAGWMPVPDGDIATGPALYTSVLPVWADRSFRSVAARVRSGLVVANVRNATEAGTTDHANVHPFTHEDYLFSHNGFIEDFATTMRRTLRARLSDAHYAGLRGMTESETLFRLLMTRIDEGRGLVDALTTTLEETIALADGLGKEAQLNLIVSDGRHVVATRMSNRDESNSLYVASDTARFPDGHLVASEPLDDDLGWRNVDDGAVVVLDARAGVQINVPRRVRDAPV
ncbi:MAG: ergothioneine biosynthesis protein EgtC [Euryarchaeota archaeon]|nr:ergothioneine biosynthesis protein EgtC [Euryarchaeota archaeon]